MKPDRQETLASLALTRIRGIGAHTARALLACGAPLCKPVCSGRDGHPLLIRSDLAKAILRSGGEGGLKGALSRCGCPVTAVFVNDEGAVHDADTPEEFRLLVQRWRDGGGKP